MIGCTCIVCKNLAKRGKLECCPIESTQSGFDSDKNNKNLDNCIPILNENINKRYERDVKTSNLYRTLNIPGRFDRTCK